MTDGETTGVSRGHVRVLGFDNHEMDFQLQRGLGAASYGGGTLGELLYVAEQVRMRTAAQPEDERDPIRHWVDTHGELARRVEELGRQALAKGHRISARDHLLRASMYYRAAEYFCDPYTPEHRRWGLASRETFILGAGLLDVGFQTVEIPCENTSIPAYFFQPVDGDARPRKTVIINTGFDGSGEELYILRRAARPWSAATTCSPSMAPVRPG